MRSFLCVSMMCCTVLLSGCAGNPMPMARGYSSYGEEFKSAPGPHVDSVGYEYTQEGNEASIEALRVPAIDLIERLDQKLSFSTDEIYLVTPVNTAFHRSFDHVLREELTKRGYVLSSEKEGAVEVHFVATHPVAGGCYDPNAERVGNRLYLALAMDVVDNIAGDVIGDYYVMPKFGFYDVTQVKVDVPCAINCCPSK